MVFDQSTFLNGRLVFRPYYFIPRPVRVREIFTCRSSRRRCLYLFSSLSVVQALPLKLTFVFCFSSRGSLGSIVCNIVNNDHFRYISPTICLPRELWTFICTIFANTSAFVFIRHHFGLLERPEIRTACLERSKPISARVFNIAQQKWSWKIEVDFFFLILKIGILDWTRFFFERVVTSTNTRNLPVLVIRSLGIY